MVKIPAKRPGDVKSPSILASVKPVSGLGRQAAVNVVLTEQPGVSSATRHQQVQVVHVKSPETPTKKQVDVHVTNPQPVKPVSVPNVIRVTESSVKPKSPVKSAPPTSKSAVPVKDQALAIVIEDHLAVPAPVDSGTVGKTPTNQPSLVKTSANSSLVTKSPQQRKGKKLQSGLL